MAIMLNCMALSCGRRSKFRFGCGEWLSDAAGSGHFKYLFSGGTVDAFAQHVGVAEVAGVLLDQI